MSSVRPFAGFNPKPSPWGYNWTPEQPESRPVVQQQRQAPPPQSPDPMYVEQMTNLPAALLSTLKREKKPFTYTPGGVNLSEVLNARLQKRMERKKRYSEEHHQPAQRQVVVMPTYNSPMDMYSMQNALEVLEVQAELVAGDKSLSASPARSATLPRNHTFRFDDSSDRGGGGVTQSKAFRVLQIMTDTEEQDPAGCSRHQDEMRFTGIRDSSANPSRFFQTLQKITGTEETEPTHAEAVVHRAPEKQPRLQPQQQPEATPRLLPQQQQPTPPPFAGGHAQLKRPAAFLPSKGGASQCGFRPVQPPCLPNGTPKRANHFAAGTDF